MLKREEEEVKEKEVVKAREEERLNRIKTETNSISYNSVLIIKSIIIFVRRKRIY